MGWSSGGVSGATSTWGGLYVCSILVGRAGLESPLALDGVDGEPGEALANRSSFVAEACGVAVSMFSGLRPEISPEGEGGGLLIVDGEASEVGDLGAFPPHCDINERTTSTSVSLPRLETKQGSLVSGKATARADPARAPGPVSNVPRERGMLAV